nr:MAG TPA: Ran binding protein [Caudoviricetes sp.]
MRNTNCINVSYPTCGTYNDVSHSACGLCKITRPNSTLK